MPDRTEQIEQMYRAFNERKPELILGILHPDVVWPNGWEGGIISGREAVGRYWAGQWAAINPIVVPKGVEELADGRIRVTVHQRVLDADGNLVVDQIVVHTYSFENGLVTSMQIEEAG